MAEVFMNRRGFVAVLSEQQGVPGEIRLDGFEESLITAAIIESPNYDQATNQQFQTSLQDAVYVYVFGDQMGRMVLNGVAFSAKCPDPEPTGLKQIMDYYDKFRASVRPSVVTVRIASHRVSGFLTRLNIAPRNVELQLYNFSMTINALPKKQRAAG
jgi:hypothetical protein